MNTTTTAVQTAQTQQPVQAVKQTLNTMLGSELVKKRFFEILGKKSAGFISSILSVVKNNDMLTKADPASVLNSAVIAATLDLTINPNLGYAYIVPYKGAAAFQMGYKGYVQLAMRTGQYKTINAVEVHEGDIVSENPFTGEYEFDKVLHRDAPVIGYMAYFKLLNGFEKYMYMSSEELKQHGMKYSQTYKRGGGLWATEFDAMAKKTVLKLLLSKYGILSIEMQTAVQIDQAVLKGDLIENGIEDVQPEYVDNNPEEQRAAAIEESVKL